MNREIHPANERPFGIFPSGEMMAITDKLYTTSIDVKHRPIKRTFDILFSLLVLIAGMPLYLILAVAIKMTSRGPIFFSQARVGRAGKLFKCYKFRSMVENAEACQQQIIDANPELQHEWLASRKLKSDPRVTFLGNFLRKTSLDELPQFWNVIKGDLSVVGPRPVVVEEMLTYYGNKAEKILSVRPGITGLWQVSGRNDITYSKRLQLDEKYVENYSMMLDLKLIAKTIPSMIFPDGAY